MQKNSTPVVRNSIVFGVFILGLAAALVFLPSRFTSSAGNNTASGLLQQTKSREAGLDNYDIRTDKKAFDKINGFRQKSNQDSAFVADIRGGFVAGEENLKAKVPTLKVEYNTDLKIPEVIAPDVKEGRAALTNATGASRADTLRNFVKENNSLIGVSDAQADNLKVTADYTNPDGNLSFAGFEQTINGVPVFRGEVKAGFNKSGEMFRVINNLAPGLDYASLSSDFGDPANAVRFAAGFINTDANKLSLTQNSAVSNDFKATFGEGDWATTAEKMYFPTEPGVAVAAWRVLIWEPVNAYYVIVDANTGTMLWRKNITEDQTQAATYNVYANPNAMINVADNPFPLTPGPTSPNTQQGAAIPRISITRVGNEPPYTFNNNGWITDGGSETDGNANEAGLDRDATNGVDVVNGRAVGTSRSFNFPVNPLNPNTNTGDAPTPAGEIVSGCTTIVQPHTITDTQRAAITQLFYINNWYHDEMYRLGFTEQARNFQASNFGRGGAEADRVSAEAQDCSGVNNANFSTPADGGRGRMQMYVWTGPTPDIDGDFDAEVIIHEHTHGLSNRLHGNGGGLSLNMSRGMGEGWSDFYAHSMLSEPTDPINGIYTAGGYDTYNISAGFTNNYYYGIRRYPKAVMAFTGANGKPHNAYTFGYVNADCNSKLTTANFAFARGPVGSSTCDQVHNLGEIWSSTLWEARAKFVTRLGWAVGNRKMLQLVTDGMKLAPLGPTMLQERDAIISAAQASSFAPEAAADVADMWSGFALRGMGFSAVVNNVGTGAGDTSVTEAFDLPNLLQTPNVSVSDATGDNDGFPEPGEPILVNIPIYNLTGNTATNTTVQIVGGGTNNYGSIVSGQTVTQGIAYTVPANTPCGSVITLTINVNSSLGATSFTRTIIIGAAQTTFTENFDSVTAPAFPTGWTAVPTNSGINFVNSTLMPDTAPNSAFAADPLTVGGGSDLTSPVIPVTASAATISFRNRFDTEGGWDGGVLEISIGGGAFQDIITAGGAFLENGYNGALGAGVNNPLANRSAWNGNSNGYINTTVRLPASAAGQNVQFRFRFGADDNTAGQGANPGWYVDNVRVNGSYACSFTPNVTVKSRADFDGDGKTDLSVFRPSEGNWYLNRSTSGFGVLHWGATNDVIVPGDFDGDGKADAAVFRPSEGRWYAFLSQTNTAAIVNFGSSGDVPQAGDFDGDNKADFAVFRPSTNVWYILNSGGGTAITGFGTAGDVPVRADYNGDGKTDIAIFRPSTGQWWIANSGGSVSVTTFGVSTDKPVPADFDGDNKEDVAVYRPSEGRWYILRSTNGAVDFVNWGISTDVPVPGDYDGDGKDDPAIYRNGTWWLLQSTAGSTAVQFGLSSDIPAPSRYIP